MSLPETVLGALHSPVLSAAQEGVSHPWYLDHYLGLKERSRPPVDPWVASHTHRNNLAESCIALVDAFEEQVCFSIDTTYSRISNSLSSLEERATVLETLWQARQPVQESTDPTSLLYPCELAEELRISVVQRRTSMRTTAQQWLETCDLRPNLRVFYDFLIVSAGPSETDDPAPGPALDYCPAFAQNVAIALLKRDNNEAAAFHAEDGTFGEALQEQRRQGAQNTLFKIYHSLTPPFHVALEARLERKERETMRHSMQQKLLLDEQRGVRLATFCKFGVWNATQSVIHIKVYRASANVLVLPAAEASLPPNKRWLFETLWRDLKLVLKESKTHKKNRRNQIVLVRKREKRRVVTWLQILPHEGPGKRSVEQCEDPGMYGL